MSKQLFDQKPGPADSKAALEVLARQRGVALAEPVAVVEVSRGWLTKTMPAAAQLMMELKAALGPDLYESVLANLRGRQGYVYDPTTGIALGAPPPEMFEMGKAQERDGYEVRRVRQKPEAVASVCTPSDWRPKRGWHVPML